MLRGTLPPVSFSVPQLQATVVGLLAAVAALLLGVASREELDFTKVELLCASSILTAFLAALALGEPHPAPAASPPGLLLSVPWGSAL